MPGTPDPARGGAGTGLLWFSPPASAQTRQRRTLSRDQVVAETLAIISSQGVQALTMRGLAARLGVVPGALYRHVHSKEDLYDLALDAVLAEVDPQPGHTPDWAAQVTQLARRLRAALERHPGLAGLLKTRDPLSPHSLALAEAFLTSLHAAGMPGPQAALAFRLIYDYTAGFSLSDPSSPGEQRLSDTTTRRELHTFLRSLPPGQFPALTTLGQHAWADDRDQRFTAGLTTIITGLQASL